MPLIQIADIREPRIIMTRVDMASTHFMELCDSIAECGLLHPIIVRPLETGKYEVVTGNHRFHACRHLGWENISAEIQYVNDDEVITLQIVENCQRKHVPNAAIGTHIRRLQRQDPSMTMAELCNRIHKSPSWVNKVLRIDRLSQEVKTMINRGHIPLENAYNLARIPMLLRRDFIDHAKVLTVPEFKSIATAVIKNYREQARKGRVEEYILNRATLQPHFRLLKDVCQEYEFPTVGPMRVVVEDCKNPLDGWKAALRWILHQDQESIDKFRQKLESRESKLRPGRKGASIDRES